ncbi:zinc ribbon domain-containing protein [Phascolarctobacterium succinatutens]|uniref:zinc ribbon domain-containing protein n=1 Tax=Phascolarctobacterium succinatutens TaxID=626940 RepID=UPI003FD83904
MFCPKCGTNVDDSYAFCFKCGFDFSKLNQSEDSSQQNYNKTTTENGHSHDQYSGMLEFDSFDGSQEQFDENYYDLCYVQRDYQKLLDFEEYVRVKYPNTTYEYNFSCGINTILLLLSSYTKENDFLKCVSVDDLNDGTVQTLADNLAFCLSTNYFMDLFGWRAYDFFSFSFKYNLAWEQYLKLQEDYEKEENVDRKNSIKWEMETIPRKFGRTTWAYEGSIIKKVNLLDLSHIQPQLTKLAEQYSNALSDLYIVILDNAIKIHNATYLQGLYPTIFQKQQIAKVIENEINDKFRNSTRNLYVVLQKEKDICNKINELSKNLSASSTAKKVAITLGLGLISGPLGLMNGIREGYNAYEAGSKATELQSKLENDFDSYLDEVRQLHEDMCECCDKLRESMKANVTDKYLVAAINDIFKKLQDNGVELLPLNRYLE